MKTETRSLILHLIGNEDGKRPVELSGKLGISPQAIHRHLKVLLAEGLVERRGLGPKVRYFIAGAPELGGARRWFSSPKEPPENPAEFVCETRDVFAARLGRLDSFERMGLAERELPLLISAVGEVGNNCFDHNLGHWRDVPGCWLQSQFTGGRLWVCIADRGQGVLRSLARVAPALKDDQSALVAAFEKNISGRAPEQRGNGLKFVKNIMGGGKNRGLACRSGAGLVTYGPLGGDCGEELGAFSSEGGGTATLIVWRVK